MDDQNKYLGKHCWIPSNTTVQIKKMLTRTDTCWNNRKNKFNFSTKATSNFITHLKTCSPKLHLQYMNLKSKHSGKIKKDKKILLPTSNQVIFSSFLFPAICFLWCHSESNNQSSTEINCVWPITTKHCWQPNIEELCIDCWSKTCYSKAFWN